MKLVITIILCFLFIKSTSAQDTFSIIQDSSRITVSGTSSAHDWDTTNKLAEGTAIIHIEDGGLQSVDSLFISFPSNSFKSGKKVMDKKTRGALKDKKNPTIQFELISISSISQDSIFAVGQFTAAGTSIERDVNVHYSISSSGEIKFEGIEPLKMTDFGIKPPSALLGSLKTGDEIVVHFTALFSSANNL